MAVTESTAPNTKKMECEKTMVTLFGNLKRRTKRVSHRGKCATHSSGGLICDFQSECPRFESTANHSFDILPKPLWAQAQSNTEVGHCKPRHRNGEQKRTHWESSVRDQNEAKSVSELINHTCCLVCVCVCKKRRLKTIQNCLGVPV